MDLVSGSVKKRAYDGSARHAQSASTRQRIVDSARDLVIERGYRAATIVAIAERAGVNADTIYQLVGRKPALIREIIEQALSGTDRAVAGEDRDYVTAMRAEPDPAKKLAIYAGAVCSLQQRLAPLFLALREASSVDPDAMAIWEEISDRRAANMRRLVRDVRDAGGFRSDLSLDDAADVMWAMNSSELFVMFTVTRGWSVRRYERWLADSWCRLLLA